MAAPQTVVNSVPFQVATRADRPCRVVALEQLDRQRLAARFVSGDSPVTVVGEVTRPVSFLAPAAPRSR